MKAYFRNRLLALGVLWGILLAAVPALVMARGFGWFLAAALVSAAFSGCVGTLATGQRLLVRLKKGAKLGGLASSLGTGLFQGLFGGGVAALLFWGLMSVTISGFSPLNPEGLSRLMSPQVFLGSFFVALSVFMYAVVVGVLLGPIFGPLIKRSAKVEEVGS